MIHEKRIFTFWEPKEKLPAYLKLCMQTWKKFLPEYEIVILDYANLNQWLGENFFDNILYKKFSLPKQADAIRCAVLKRYGGIWMDCDTILTSNKVRNFLSLKSSFILIGSHIAFIIASSRSYVLKQWLKGIYSRMTFYKKYNSFNLVDFITYLGDNSELVKRVSYIDSLELNKEYTMEEIDNYFDTIKEFSSKKQIENLQEKLKNETNDVVRKEIAKKIIDIKMNQGKK